MYIIYNSGFIRVSILPQSVKENNFIKSLLILYVYGKCPASDISTIELYPIPYN